MMGATVRQQDFKAAQYPVCAERDMGLNEPKAYAATDGTDLSKITSYEDDLVNCRCFQASPLNTLANILPMGEFKSGVALMGQMPEGAKDMFSRAVAARAAPALSRPQQARVATQATCRLQ